MNVSNVSAASLTPATTRPTSASEAAAAAKAGSGLTPMQQGTSSKALEDPNVTLDTGLTYTAQAARSAKEQEEFDYGVALTHRQQPMQQANSALDTIEDRLGEIQKSISAQRPDLGKAGWDFTVSEGKLKVTGNISASDKQWIEAKLNGDTALKNAATSYVEAAKAYLETNDENPAYGAINGFTHSALSYNFADVKDQFASVGGFRNILETLNNRYNNPANGGVLNPGDYRGADSLEYVASLLK